MKKIKVLIADDHEIMRVGLATMLETDSAIKIVAEAADGAEAVRKTLQIHPDVVVMDLMMPEQKGPCSRAPPASTSSKRSSESQRAIMSFQTRCANSLSRHHPCLTSQNASVRF